MGPHGHVRRHGIKTGLVDPAAKGRVLGHQLAKTIGPFLGVLIDLVFFVAVLGDPVDETLT